MSARTAKSRTLGAGLRKAREQRGLTLRALAKLVEQDQGVLSRWETGDRGVKPEQVARILTTLGVQGDQYEDLIALAQRADEPLWSGTIPMENRQQVMAVCDYERNASRITEVSPLVIPGLLQTKGYTRAILEGAGMSADETESRVAIRAERKEVLLRPDPVRHRVVIGFAALANALGGREVMLEQLRHLCELAKLPNIEVRVLPLNAGWTPAMGGCFSLLEFEQASALVHIESRGLLFFLHERRGVESCRAAAEKSLAATLSTEDSIELIMTMWKRLHGDDRRK